MYCPNCGKELPNDSAFCNACGNDVNAPPTAGVQCVFPMKSAGIAAVLSFFIAGLGQIYIGKLARGLVILVGGIAIGCASIVLVAMGLDANWDTMEVYGFDVIASYGLLILFLISIVYWVWQIYDAYKLTNDYNDKLAKTNQRPW